MSLCQRWHPAAVSSLCTAEHQTELSRSHVSSHTDTIKYITASPLRLLSPALAFFFGCYSQFVSLYFWCCTMSIRCTLPYKENTILQHGLEWEKTQKIRWMKGVFYFAMVAFGNRQQTQSAAQGLTFKMFTLCFFLLSILEGKWMSAPNFKVYALN